MIRVRIAPSPTGFAHVGTGYIALFNYAFAKKNKGKFIVRLEDTDVKREVRGAEDAVYKGLSWLGLSWDEGPDISGKYGPYRQSERLDLYKERAKELLDKGLAYEDEGAIRFKSLGKNITWNDMVRGEVSFSGGEITDFVIMKSDGFPTYHFGVVVDDIDMDITHVIRGEDHISNTPKHLALYNVFGVKPPIYGHLPTLRNAETGKKLSKRRDTVDLQVFKKQGYLPEAVVNFMCLQGWSHPDGKDIFSLKEFVEKFDMDRVRKAGPKFDFMKLDWMNGEYMRELSDSEFASRILGFYDQKYDYNDSDLIKMIAPIVKDRIKKLSDFKSFAGFFFDKPKVDTKLFGKDYKEHLEVAIKVLEKTDKWTAKELETFSRDAIAAKKFDTGKFFMTLRIAITGSKFTPPINESIIILGKVESIKRIQSALT